MSGYSPPLDEVGTALLGLLRTGATEGEARWVYDGAYAGDPLSTDPYGILYPIPGGDADPMPDLDLDLRTVTAVWQVTSVAPFRNQAQATDRHYRDLILARTPDGAGWLHDLVMPAGWLCIDRRPDPALPGAVRSGEHPNAVYSSPARYRLTIAPA